MAAAKTPKPRKPKIVNIGKLKAKPKPKAIRTKTYHVQMGRQANPDHIKTYEHEGQARAAVLNAIESHRPWCKRYNSAGEAALDSLRQQLSAMVYDRSRSFIEACIDEHTQTTIHIEFWRQ